MNTARHLRRAAPILFFVLLLIITAAYIFSAPKMHTIQIFDLFDTYSTVSVKSHSDELLAKYRDFLTEGHELFNCYGESQITEINRSAGISAHEQCDSRVIELLELSKKYSLETDGYFDVTAGALCTLWESSERDGVLPSEDTIASLLPLVCSEDIILHGSSALLRRPGQSINTGAIAKGFCTDKLAELMRADGIDSAMINLGGNIYALGEKSIFSPWTVGIRSPVSAEELIGVLSIENKAVSTSGDYQQHFEIGGRIFNHILDPHTGMPSDNGIRSVSIVADSSARADAFSTALFSAGYEEGRKILEKYSDIYAIFVTDDAVYYSSELENIFTHENQNYTYTAF